MELILWLPFQLLVLCLSPSRLGHQLLQLPYLMQGPQALLYLWSLAFLLNLPSWARQYRERPGDCRLRHCTAAAQLPLSTEARLSRRLALLGGLWVSVA